MLLNIGLKRKFKSFINLKKNKLWNKIKNYRIKIFNIKIIVLYNCYKLFFFGLLFGYK